MANDSLSTPLLSKASEAEEKPPLKESVKLAKTHLTFHDVGVWTVMREVHGVSSWKLSGRAMVAQGKELMAILSIVYHFLQECFSVSPWIMTVYLLSMLWSGAEDAVGLFFSSRLLNIIQDSVSNRQLDGYALTRAVISRIAYTLVTSVVGTTRRRTAQTLASRVRYLFEEQLITANLQLDLLAFKEPETASKIKRCFGQGTYGGAWGIFEGLLTKLRYIASIATQLIFLFGALSSQPGGHWFAMVCLGQSLFTIFSRDSIWAGSSYVWDSNPHYRRIRSLLSIVTESRHRIEVISDALVSYIQREWKRARILLGDTSDDHPYYLWNMKRSHFLSFLDGFAEDSPLIFYAFQVYLVPQSFSLTSIALIQQSSSTLTWTLYGLFKDNKSLPHFLEEIKTLNKLRNIQNKLQDGKQRYPGDVSKSSPGMEIKFQNVSFSYTETETVIKDVSFTIRKGQAVVIVGINGSGKSTLLRLFNRLYDPSSGTVLIDGTPLSSLVASDVRHSTAMLSQNYTHYPLSIRENISMGLPDADYGSMSEEDEKKQQLLDDLVKEAARLGGSTDIIEKQPKGFDAVLQPSRYSHSTSSTGGSRAFHDKMKEISKEADVSLGQWQRLALSRLFFRAAGKHIKLVAVDEPSASLDPKMEYELFERLRSMSTTLGKTMVFVTHRFGYLTKRADLILVMQDGCLVEQGKHSDLLELGGEYAKLFKLQAEAFLPDDEKA